jgi:glycosyltransferase involved in cell wall biosynthesis
LEYPLVSVVVPAYNASAYIEDAIRSVLEQDYPALEVIVVDDGSRDGTPDLARRFGANVRVVEQENGGPAVARNRAVKLARGDLLAFIDADDLWLPGKLKAQVDYLREHPETGLVHGRYLRWVANPDGSFGPPPALPVKTPACETVTGRSGWIYPELLLGSLVWIVSVLMPKSLWESLGGMDESLRCGEDYDFFLRASRICRLDELDRVVAYYRIHPESTTHVVRDEDYEYMVMRRALDAWGVTGPDGREVAPKLLRDRFYRLFFNHGYRHFYRGKPEIAAASFRRALCDGRVSWRAVVYWILSSMRRIGFPK